MYNHHSLIRRIRRRLHLGHRLYYRSAWVNAPYESQKPAVIVGGCDRSGTTLLRAALDSHPAIAAGPESWVYCYKLDLRFLADEYEIPIETLRRMHRESSGLAEFSDRLLSAYAQRQGKPIWCEKSPRNVMRLDYIWKHFPNARFIHVVRDGRDVVCSLRRHPRHRRVGSEYVPVEVDRPVRDCVWHWVTYASAGIRHRGDDRYIEVRYEDLVRDYAGQVKRICDHCAIDFCPQLLEREKIQSQRSDTEIVNPEARQPLYDSSIGRWRRDLSESEQRLVMRKGGDLLKAFGYC